MTPASRIHAVSSCPVSPATALHGLALGNDTAVIRMRVLESGAVPKGSSAAMDAGRSSVSPVDATDENVPPASHACVRTRQEGPVPVDTPPQLADSVADVSKYSKMLRMGVPRAAVEARMRQDGADPVALAAGAHVGDAPVKPAAPSTTNALPEELRKYQRMLTMGVPPGAVMQRARSDGLGEAHLQLLVRNGDVTSPARGSCDDASAVVRPTIAPAALVRRPSCPSLSPTKKPVPVPAQPVKDAWAPGLRKLQLQKAKTVAEWWKDRKPQLTGSKLLEAQLLFGASSGRAVSRSPSRRAAMPQEPERRTRPSLLEARRVANVTIVLARYGYPSFDALWRSVRFLDVSRSGLREEAVRALIELAPSETERDALQPLIVELRASAGAAIAPPPPPADVWLASAAMIPRFVPRTRHLILQLELPALEQHIVTSAELICAAAACLSVSSAFECILDMVAALTAAIAGSSAPTDAAPSAPVAFKLSSLPSLCTVRSFDGRVRALSFTASVWPGWACGRAGRDHDHAMTLKEAMDSVMPALTACTRARVSWESVQGEVRLLHTHTRTLTADIAAMTAATTAMTDADKEEAAAEHAAHVSLASALSAAVARCEAAVSAARTATHTLTTKFGEDDACDAAPETLLAGITEFLTQLLKA